MISSPKPRDPGNAGEAAMSMALRLLIPLIAIVACIKAFQQPAGLATQMTIATSNEKASTIIQYGKLPNGELGYLVFAISNNRADPLKAPVRISIDHGELVLPNGNKIGLPARDQIFAIKDSTGTGSRTIFSSQDFLEHLEIRPDEYSIDGHLRFVQWNDGWHYSKNTAAFFAVNKYHHTTSHLQKLITPLQTKTQKSDFNDCFFSFVVIPNASHYDYLFVLPHTNYQGHHHFDYFYPGFEKGRPSIRVSLHKASDHRSFQASPGCKNDRSKAPDLSAHGLHHDQLLARMG